MPGSRQREIDQHLAPMVALARKLVALHSDLRIVIPHRDPDRARLIRAALEPLPDSRGVAVVADDPAAWLAGARVALVKSGTGSLEACLHGVPAVVVYTVDGALARFVYHRMLTVPFFASANLCMDRRIVPEVAIEAPSQWSEVLHHVVELFEDTAARTQCLADLEALRERLGEPGASARAARWVVPFCPTGESAAEER